MGSAPACCSGPATATYTIATRILSGLTGVAMTSGTASCTVTLSGLTNEPAQVGTCPVAAQTNLAASVTTTNATNTSTDQCLSVTATAPNAAKAFGAATIADGATTTLVFTLSNTGTNPAQSGIALGDTLPAGLRFNTTTPAVAYSAGCSGPATATYTVATRILSGLTGIAVSSGTASCTVTLSGLTNEPAPLNYGLPKEIVDVLAVAPTERNEGQSKSLLAHFRAQDAAIKSAEAGLAKASQPLPPDPKLEEIKARLVRAQRPHVAPHLGWPQFAFERHQHVPVEVA